MLLRNRSSIRIRMWVVIGCRGRVRVNSLVVVIEECHLESDNYYIYIEECGCCVYIYDGDNDL